MEACLKDELVIYTDLATGELMLRIAFETGETWEELANRAINSGLPRSLKINRYDKNAKRRLVSNVRRFDRMRTRQGLPLQVHRRLIRYFR